MTATTSVDTIPRTGPAVRAWLVDHAPDQVAGFDRAFAEGLAEAGRTYDVAQLEAVIRSWWGLAWARANVTRDEVAMFERVEQGDFRGLSMMQPDGTFRRL